MDGVKKFVLVILVILFSLYFFNALAQVRNKLPGENIAPYIGSHR
jgi:hypothetical protein